MEKWKNLHKILGPFLISVTDLTNQTGYFKGLLNNVRCHLIRKHVIMHPFLKGDEFDCRKSSIKPPGGFFISNTFRGFMVVRYDKKGKFDSLSLALHFT